MAFSVRCKHCGFYETEHEKFGLLTERQIQKVSQCQGYEPWATIQEAIQYLSEVYTEMSAAMPNDFTFADPGHKNNSLPSEIEERILANIKKHERGICRRIIREDPDLLEAFEECLALAPA